jgi:hypothetical protein
MIGQSGPRPAPTERVASAAPTCYAPMTVRPREGTCCRTASSPPRLPLRIRRAGRKKRSGSSQTRSSRSVVVDPQPAGPRVGAAVGGGDAAPGVPAPRSPPRLWQRLRYRGDHASAAAGPDGRGPCACCVAGGCCPARSRPRAAGHSSARAHHARIAAAARAYHGHGVRFEVPAIPPPRPERAAPAHPAVHATPISRTSSCIRPCAWPERPVAL